MKKPHAVLLKIANIKCQRAEGEYQSVRREVLRIETRLTAQKNEIASLSSRAGDDFQSAIANQHYAELLIQNIRKTEIVREQMQGKLSQARSNLQKAMFSVSQLNEQ